MAYQIVPSSLLVGASVMGLTPVAVTNTPNVNTAGSVVAFQGGAWTTSVVGNVGQTGTVITSLVSTIPSSVIVGTSIFGQLPAGTAPIGSVATLQGTNPWLTSFGNSSIFALSVGSVITLNQGSSILAVPVGSTIAVLKNPSIAGTYEDDAVHATSDKGLFILGVRNDALSSVTSADLDYSPITVGPAGEMINANAPLTKWIQGTASMLGGTPVNGGSVAVIAAQGASIFTYITGIQIANASPNNVWLRFDGGTSSVIGYTVAPANGGSNIVLQNAWKTVENAAFTASISGVASVYLSAEGFISKV